MFDRPYYEGLWGTVHRHDYCASLADQLIAQHRPRRVLDIGTGCGRLVRELRVRGVDAWGLELSEYAVTNTCAPGFVRHGDMRDIPFGSGFDVVHSQGVWEYIPEGDIPKAWSECRRVGQTQVHTIDYAGAGLGEEEFVTARSPGWWQDQFHPPVLVACANHRVKEYAFGRWLENVRRFTYPNLDVLVVDNSPNGELLHYDDCVVWDGVAAADRLHPFARISHSMSVIQKRFLAGRWARWFNVESDVLPPPDAIEQMLGYGGQTDWISHSFPVREDPTNCQQGIGCSILSRRLMEAFDLSQAGDDSPDGWLWQRVRPDPRFTTMELWGYFDVIHLPGPGPGDLVARA